MSATRIISQRISIFSQLHNLHQPSIHKCAIIKTNWQAVFNKAEPRQVHKKEGRRDCNSPLSNRKAFRLWISKKVLSREHSLGHRLLPRMEKTWSSVKVLAESYQKRTIWQNHRILAGQKPKQQQKDASTTKKSKNVSSIDYIMPKSPTQDRC